MAEELFPNPTVKEVIFQIRFPNLFYMESKIGEFQMKIMEDFPQSEFAQQRSFVIGNAPSAEKIKEISENQDSTIENIWKFISPKNYEITVSSNSLSVVSKIHKSYNNQNAEHRFRDAIDKALASFFEVAKVPIINRIGLRYIDICPIPEKTTKKFKEYYKTTLPVGRFKIEDANSLHLRATLKKGDFFLNFGEKFATVDSGVEGEEEYKLMLDYDGYAENVKPDECLTVTDKLYKIIASEYKKSIKEPVKEYMRASL